MNLLSSDSKTIKENLAKAKKIADDESERFRKEQEENKRKQEEKELKEQEEIESIKAFVKDLVEQVLGTNQYAEWINPNEEDCGENYFAIQKNSVGGIYIHLWSKEAKVLSIPELEKVETVALARMIRRRFDWIASNNIQPVVRNIC